MHTQTNGYTPGLAGVIAAQTRLSSVNGQIGELIIGGFPLEELALNAAFEETIYLLLFGRLPTGAALASFSEKLASRRDISPAALRLLESAAKEGVPVMDALRMAASTLSLGETSDAPVDEAVRIIARFPTIVAAYWRLREGREPIAPDRKLGHAANYLYMLTGEMPSAARIRGLETYLNTVVDHGLNASTFTARVIISTDSDLVSAVTGAIGALKGPLHGGAPGPALDMVFEIGAKERAEPYLRSLLGRGERLMGFGHRVYKVRDPRAEVLSEAAQKMYREDGDMELYELARHVEKMAVRLLEEYKPGRNLQTNVEFYTALLLHGLGLETALFSPTFAVSRVVGWLAHGLEQQDQGRIIRPKSEYVGAKDRRWAPVEARIPVGK